MSNKCSLITASLGGAEGGLHHYALLFIAYAADIWCSRALFVFEGGLHARIPAPSIVLLCVSRESKLSGGGRGASCQGYQKPESVPG